MLSIRSLSKFLVISVCVVLIMPHSKALLLGSFIGCNSFGCRLSALENDVAQLKQQVARLGGSPIGQQQMGGQNFRPGNNMMQPFGNNMNNMGQQQGLNPQGLNQQGLNQQGNQQANQQQNGPQGQNNVRFSPDFPMRSLNPDYPTITSGQFLRA